MNTLSTGWIMTQSDAAKPWIEWALRAILTGLLGFAVAYLRDSSRELAQLNVSMVRVELENRRIGDRFDTLASDTRQRIGELALRVDRCEAKLFRPE